MPVAQPLLIRFNPDRTEQNRANLYAPSLPRALETASEEGASFAILAVLQGSAAIETRAQRSQPVTLAIEHGAVSDHDLAVSF